MIFQTNDMIRLIHVRHELCDMIIDGGDNNEAEIILWNIAFNV